MQYIVATYKILFQSSYMQRKRNQIWKKMR